MLRFRRICALAVVLAAGAAVAGCKSNLKSSLSQGKQEMEASATEGMKVLEQERAETIRKAFGERESLATGQEHWLIGFGKLMTSDDVAARAEALAKTHERSAIANQFKDAADFLLMQKSYWDEPKGGLNMYVDYLSKMMDKGLAPDTPFLEHIRFELEILHAVNWEKSKKYDEDTRLTNFYRYWKFAFDFKPEKREPFMNYVNRLCRAKLWDYCKPLMWEHRPYAMTRPYLEQLIANLEKFQSDYPQSAYNELAKEFVAMYRRELGGEPTFEEYPQLPDGRTDRDAVGGDQLVVGPRGITWNGLDLKSVKDGNLALGPKDREAAAKALDEKLKRVLEDLAEQFDEPTIELVVTQFDRATPLATLAPLLATFLEDKVTELGLLARRRADGSNRKVGIYLATYWTPWPPMKDIEDRKTAAEKKADEEARLEHDPRRKFPTDLAGMKCRAIGRTGKLMAETAQPVAYLAFTAKEAATGAIEAPASYVEETAKAAAPEAKRPAKEALADPAFLDGWVGGLTGPAVLAFDGSWTYGDLTNVLHRTLVACNDEACLEPTERDLQLTIALCE